MNEKGAERTYKSPQRKLVKFFEKSRDQWKAKCREAKHTVKRLRNRICYLERSKAHWKQRAKEMEKELAQLKAQESIRVQEEEALKKRPRKRLLVQ